MNQFGFFAFRSIEFFNISIIISSISKAADELIVELEILNAKKQEAEVAIAYINSEAKNSCEEIEENKQHLEEINEEIAEREKMCMAYEKKIDKILNAGKPVKKELDVIRKRTKELPRFLAEKNL